ncbi:hypothetical protein FK530_18960 [Tsukamurella conjunctivitidis]|uniref:Terminase small subunit n=1 Tax=Tsukamurella conjunctivitidis TaxID=2592068 RepID=A0A5C5RY23_9ACTN|nr:hypothetical protein [Tsukamurella conjunctivitidis]TWS27403.1 hypothetical protein FK530_18960 [Tsukamurella conjunctivitidis]
MGEYGFGEAGEALWVAISAAYHVDSSNEVLVVQACRIADQAERVNDALRDGSPLMVENHRGDLVASPLVVELRNLASTLKQLFAALGISKLERYAGSSRPRGPAGQIIDKARSKIDLQREIAEKKAELAAIDDMDRFLAGELD